MYYFTEFCNVCRRKDTDSYVNICKDEHKHILEILLSFLDSADIIQNADIYLCPSCCKQLLSYKEFREMCVENLVNLRELHAKWKFKLESETDVSTEKELAFFTANTMFEGPNSDCISELKIGDDSVHDQVDPLMIKKEEDVEPAEVLAGEALGESGVPEQICVLPADHWDTKLHEEVDLDESGDELEDMDEQDGHMSADSTPDTTTEVSNNWTDDSLTKNNCSQGGPAGAFEEQRLEEDSARLGLKRAHSIESPYKCEVCGGAFTDKYTLIRHKRVHSSEKPYKCEVCGRIFMDNFSLVRHMRVHSGEKPYLCELCSRAFADKASMVRHKRVHSDEKPYKCEVCARAFAHKSRLVTHERLHNGERPYKCELCPSAFVDRTRLVRHRHVHSNEKPFKCEVCERAFAEKFLLVKHMRVHTGRRPYNCDQCPSAFPDKSKLARHQRVHSGKKPHKCEVCGHAFTENYSLVIHKRVHTGEKQYKCEVCPRAFMEKSSLVRHMGMHISGTP